jgi:hypothetical protein
VVNILPAAFLLAFIPSLMFAAQGDTVERTGDAALGKQLYWRGITSTGKPIKGVTGTDIVLSGTQLSCVTCHRPSGFGSSEGGKYVPPITGPILFSPRELNRNRIFFKMFKEAQPRQFSANMREPRMRSAYSAATLATAIRTGADPVNRKLDPEMPRYDLDMSNMANLVAYLKTLSGTHDPGVEENTIHFATVVTDNADSGQREAVLNTISTFFEWMNTRVEGNRNRPNFSPNYHSDFQNSFQHWQLHVWHVQGPSETWTEQIQAQNEQTPVFALVSGLVYGPWTPIARFCNAERIPCIFPNTELPKTADSDYGYSLYFSRGLELEAEVIARFLAARVTPDGSILQIHSSDASGLTPANAFTRAAKSQMPRARVQNIQVSSAEELRRAIRQSAARTKVPDALILWPGQYLPDAVASLRALTPEIKIISLPADALDITPSETLAVLPKTLLFTYPYELPTVYYPRVFRVRQWMNSRKLAISYPRLQFQTYYALTLLQSGLDQILDDYFRDYLIEAIEHEAESHLNNGTHPALALGPSQRFASKGAYVVRVDPTSPGGFQAVSEWIVP